MKRPLFAKAATKRGKALEKKKALAKQLLTIAARQEPKREDLQASHTRTGLPASLNGDSPTLRGATLDIQHVRRAGFTVHKLEDAQPVAVHEGVERLANVLAWAAKEKQARHVLLWPGSLKAFALAHAVATLSEWNLGNKRGIRTLLYPARANFLQGLNGLTLARKEIASLAARQYEDPDGTGNPLVTVSMREKDSFLTCLNSVHLDEENLDPTVAELIPHFFCSGESTAWTFTEGNLLRRIKAQLGDRSWTRALNQHIQAVNTFEQAPDTLLALGWRTQPQGLESVMRRLKQVGTPDVIVVDLTRATRRILPNWRRAVIRFLEVLAATFTENAPGLLLVTEDPHVRLQLFREWEKRAKAASARGSRLNERIRTWIYASCVGVAFTSEPQGYTPLGEEAVRSAPCANLVVTETDRTASAVILGFEALKSRTTEESERRALAAAIAFLTRLVSMPSSVNVLCDWLDQSGMPMEVREMFSWPAQRVPLTQLVNSGTFTDGHRLRALLDGADEMWKAYADGTPFVHILMELIEEHTRGESTCTLVFTRPTALRLAERFFESFSYEGLEPGEGYAILRDKLRLTTSAALPDALERADTTTLVFAGLDEDALRHLVCDSRIKGKAHVLLTARNARYLKSALRNVAQTEGLQGRFVRVEQLLELLKDYPDLDEVKFSNEDYVLPSFSFEAGLAGSASNADDSDPEAWHIQLDNGQHIHRSPASTLYLYDPVRAQAASRGFRAVQVRSLRRGDRVFVMSGELREQTEAALKSAGVAISKDRRFEAQLMSYHQRIKVLVDLNVPGTSQIDKAQRLRETMLTLDGCPSDLPQASAIKSWIDAHRWLNTPFEENQPHAPRKASHFQYFGQAVGLSTIEIVFFWKTVIQGLRSARSVDGRRISDAYTDILMEHESFSVHQHLDASVVQRLFQKAQDNVYAIEDIIESQVKEEDHAHACT